MGDGEDNVRQRIKTEKAALKEKVEMIKSKMKEKEASQQRKENVIVVLKPVFFIILIIILLYGFYFYFSQEDVSQVYTNNLMADGDVEGEEEIIAEVEEEWTLT